MLLLPDNSPYENLAYLIAQLLGSIGIVAAAWVKIAPKIREWKATIRFKKARAEVLKNARILRGMSLLIREWRVKYAAQRILLLHAKNGGKPWPLTDKIKVSCLDQTVAASEENTWERWQDWHIDPPYRELLTDLLITKDTQKGILINTRSMNAGVLKDVYEGQGTVASVIFPVTWIDEENALVYVSINFGHGIKDHTVTEEDAVRYEKMARDLFHKPDEIRKLCTASSHTWNVAESISKQ